jgi:hypothetical protein
VTDPWAGAAIESWWSCRTKELFVLVVAEDTGRNVGAREECPPARLEASAINQHKQSCDHQLAQSAAEIVRAGVQSTRATVVAQSTRPL